MGAFHRVGRFDERAYGSRGGVENRHLVFFYHAPEAAGIRVSGDAFKHHLGDAHGQWAVSHVAVTGNPAHVCGTPKNVIVFDVKGPAHAVHGMQ